MHGQKCGILQLLALTNITMRSIFVAHGGGPMPLLYPQKHVQMHRQMNAMSSLFPAPKAILIFSAHWEEQAWTILDNDNPGLLFDYGGFPQESYSYKYPARSTKELRQEVENSLNKAGIVLKKEEKRGYDHGVFVPLMLMYPKANIPVIQISLLKNLNPRKHFQMGVALRELKKRDFLILGSGSSIHGGFFDPSTSKLSQAFDKQLGLGCLKDQTDEELCTFTQSWRKLPFSAKLHPREEHLVPLFVCLGAKQPKGKKQKWDLEMFGLAISNFLFE